jgi:hypothetical protein
MAVWGNNTAFKDKIVCLQLFCYNFVLRKTHNPGANPTTIEFTATTPAL